MYASSLRIAILAAACGSIASASLIHQYTFDSGPQATDSVGSANGLLAGSASISGGVLNLTGAPDLVQFSNHLIPTSAPYTVAFNFQTSGSPQSGIIEFISQGSSGGPGFYMGGNGGSGFRMSDVWSSPAGTFPLDTAWHQIALVVGPSQSFFYIDGSLADTFNSTINTTSGGSDTRFGSQFAPYGENFVGRMDNVRIWDGALSAREIAGIDDAPGVPEPATSLLLALGLAAGFVRHRKARG